MSSIPVIGLPASDMVPGAPLQINFAAGLSGLGATALRALIIGNWIMATGAGASDTLYGPDTLVPMLGEDDAATLAGPRSEARRMVRWFKRNNTSTPLYMICPPDAGTAATGTIAVSLVSPATAANAAGYVRVRINRAEYVDVPFAKGDSTSTIASNIDLYMKSQAHWPVTTSPALGVVTVTAAQKGLAGNKIHIQANVFPADGTTGIAVTDTTMTALTTGATSDNWTTTLAQILGKRFYWIISADDSSRGANALALLQAQVDSEALPVNGNRQCVIAGGTDTLANTITETTALNDPRVDFVWQQSGDIEPCCITAHAGGAFALGESLDPPLCNFDGWGSVTIEGIGDTAPLWSIPAPMTEARLTRTQLNSALQNGITPLQTAAGGRTYVVARVTTKFLTNSQVDYRIRDSHKRRVMDYFGDVVQPDIQAAIAGKVIGDDIPSNQRNPNALLFTPSDATNIVKRAVLKCDAKTLLQQVSTTLAGIVSMRDSGAPSRITTSVTLVPVDACHQAPIVANQGSATL